MDGREIIDGWLGTTNDRAAYGRGEWGSLDAARAAIVDLAGRAGIRPLDDDNPDPIGETDEGRSIYPVETWLHGSLEEWGRDTSQNWCCGDLGTEITSASTDAEIDAWVSACADAAVEEGGELDTDAVREMAREYRDTALAADDLQRHGR